VNSSEVTERTLDSLLGKSVLDFDSACTFFTNPAGTIQRAGKGAVHALEGNGPEDLVGKTFFDLLAPGQLPAAKKWFAEVIAGVTEPQEFELISLRANVFWVQAHSARVGVLEKYCAGVLIFLINISGRKHAEGSLRDAEWRYRRMFESAAIGIYQTSLEGKFLNANAALLKILGYGNLEELQASVEDIAGQLYVNSKRHGELLGELQAKGEVSDFESQVYCRDKRKIWIQENGRRVYDPQREFLYVEGFVREITASKGAEDDLELLHTAIQDLEEGVIITDNTLDAPGPTIIFANGAVTRISGFSSEELIGRNPRIFQGPYTDRNVLATVREALQKGEPFDGEINNHRKDGSAYLVGWHLSPVRDSSGGVTHWVSVQRDLSTVRLREQELQQGRRLQVIGELASGVAHEFNNLLAPMMAEIDVVEELCPDEAEVRGHLRPIRQAVEQAAQLTKRILQLGRKNQQKREWIDLNASVEQAVELFRKTMDRRIQMQLVLEEKMPLLWGSSGDLSQVLLNMALNSRDTLMDKINLRPDPSWVPELVFETAFVDGATGPSQSPSSAKAVPCQRLTVTDNGMGMSDKTRSRLFEAFFTTKEPGKGTGLGTALMWNIMTSCGGWIEVDTQVGVGTSFHLYFPVEKGEAKEPSQPEPAPLVPALTHATDFRSWNILLVDDYQLLAETFSRFLTRQGHNLKVALHGREALQLLRENPQGFDLLLTDLNMPSISGLDMIREARAMGFKGRILIMSGYISEQEQEELDALDIDGILTKPFKPSDISERLKVLATQGLT